MGGRDETDAALAALGLKREGDEHDFAPWPAHAKSVDVFAALLTQWRVAPSGVVIGLDYTPIPAVLEMVGIAREAWPEIFGHLRIMESEAVNVINAERRQ